MPTSAVTPERCCRDVEPCSGEYFSEYIMTEFLTSPKAQTIAIWSWWILITLSTIILVFTGIDQSWDDILLRISTASALIAANISKLIPKKIKKELNIEGIVEGEDINVSGVVTNARITT